MSTLHYSDVEAALYDDRGRRFDPWAREWRPAAAPADGRVVEPDEAVRLIFRRPTARRLPVAVIGPRQATPAQEALAGKLGRALGGFGLTVLTGGKGGVMAAVCKGVMDAGGLTVALVPDEDWHLANEYVAIPLATGIGPARNALIARAAIALIAVGGEYGTLTEIAFGLHFDKPVLTLGGAPAVDGAIVCADVDDVIRRLLPVILAYN